MSFGPAISAGIFLFFLVFTVTVVKNLVEPAVPKTRWSKRATFESWARQHGLNLTRSRVCPDQYEQRETWLAWEAFNLGLYTPREIRI